MAKGGVWLGSGKPEPVLDSPVQPYILDRFMICNTKLTFWQSNS